jgi:hypothetical protein
MKFAFSVISSTHKGAYVKAVRSDSAMSWTQNVRVLYKVHGVRYVDTQTGVLFVGPSGAKTPKDFVVLAHIIFVMVN